MSRRRITTILIVAVGSLVVFLMVNLSRESNSETAVPGDPTDNSLTGQADGLEPEGARNGNRRDVSEATRAQAAVARDERVDRIRGVVASRLALRTAPDLADLTVERADADLLLVPFLAERLKGALLWRARFRVEGIELGSLGERHLNNQLRQGEVLLLDEGLVLLQAKFEQGGVGSLPGEMLRIDAEARYQWTGETWHGPPRGNAEPTVQGILDLAVLSAPAQIWDSKRLLIALAETSRDQLLEQDERWIVYFLGFPPYPAKGISDATDDERSHLRLIFAADGEFIGGDNQPLVTGAVNK